MRLKNGTIYLIKFFVLEQQFSTFYIDHFWALVWSIFKNKLEQFKIVEKIYINASFLEQFLKPCSKCAYIFYFLYQKTPGSVSTIVHTTWRPASSVRPALVRTVHSRHVASLIGPEWEARRAARRGRRMRTHSAEKPLPRPHALNGVHGQEHGQRDGVRRDRADARLRLAAAVRAASSAFHYGYLGAEDLDCAVLDAGVNESVRNALFNVCNNYILVSVSISYFFHFFRSPPVNTNGSEFKL